MDALAVAMLMAVVLVARSLTRTSIFTDPEGTPAPAPLVYVVAVAAFAVALVPPATERVVESGGLDLSGLPVPAAGAVLGGTGRVAAPFPNAPVQSFVAIDAFEVRRETLVRVGMIAGVLGVAAEGDIGIEAQADLKLRVAGLVAGRSVLQINGVAAGPVSSRVDFMQVDAQGALPRVAPVPEPMTEALVGVTEVFLLPTTPRQVTLRWDDFERIDEVPVTFTDPEASESVVLTPAAAVAQWDNTLAEDPIPVVTATAVEPATLWLPLVSLVAVAAAFWCLAASLSRRSGPPLALARVMLAVALLAAPMANVAVPMPASFGAVPDADGARRILSGVLPNIYKAFEFRSEEAAFDRLSLSVTGDTLTEVYLEHRRALEMEERGGARARVEAFEVTDVGEVKAGEDGGFVAEATWTVGGTVVHFGHRHFRQNRYDARVSVVPVDGTWKIQSIEILDEERLR